MNEEDLKGAPPTSLAADVGGAEDAQGRGAYEPDDDSTVSMDASSKKPPTLLDMALWYARHGLPVFPLIKYLKIPATKDGFKNATTDHEQIERWFKNTDKNLGVVPCSVSQDKALLVIDVDVKDDKDGRIALALREAELGTLPDTLIVDTPSSGHHRYFWYDPSEYPMKGIHGNRIGSGIDIRAESNGYVVGICSHLEAGADKNGKQATGDYVVSCRVPIADLPIAWCSFLAKKEEPTQKSAHRNAPPPRQDQQMDDARDALKFINAADGKTWVDVGFSLAGTFGESGWALFDDWSLTHPEKYNTRENRKRWDSFFPSSKTVASIFQMAAENGWRNPAKGQRPSGNQQNGTQQNRKATTPTPPQPLPPDLPPVMPFDYDFLPNCLGAWVQDIALRMSAPPDFIVASLLVVLGSVIGRKVAIRPMENTDWAVVANIWGAIVGRASMMKSPSMAAAQAPMRRLEAAAARVYQEEMETYGYAEEMAKIEKEVITKQVKKSIEKASGVKQSPDLLRVDEPEKPILKRYSTNSFTEAAVTVVLQENPNGVMVVRDELVGLLKSLESEGNSGLRALLLESWNGEGQYLTDRITRGMGMKVDGLCLSLMGGIQPGPIASYLKSSVVGGAGDDGLIQRFGLLVWPDPVPYQEHDEVPDKLLAAEVNRIFARLDTLTPDSVGAMQDVDDQGEPDGLPYLRFEYEALGLFKEWHSALMNRIRGDDVHPAMESHLMKYKKLVPALALIFHLVEVGRGAVGVDSLYRALSMADYLETHAARAYASVTMGKVAGAKTLLGKIKAQKLGNPFRARDVLKAGWTGFDKDTTHEALDLLVDYGWLEEHESDGSKGGRPTTDYYLNPLAEGLL